MSADLNDAAVDLDLEPLVPLMAGLEARDSDQREQLDAVRAGLTAALGEAIASSLCDGARTTSEIATRFFRVRARQRISSTLRDNPR